MATRTARSVDRTVDKMLRQMAQSSKATAGASGSSSTAAQAIAQMAEIQKRIARGDTDAAQFLIEKAKQPKTAEGLAEDRREKLEALKSQAAANGGLGNSKNLMAAIAGGAALLLVLGGFGISSLFAGHSVSGTVMLDSSPLSKVELLFHPKSVDVEPIRVTTCPRGTFKLDSVPAGDYAIYVSPDNLDVRVPKKYLAPDTTPFELKLNRDRKNLRMLAVSEPSN
jgi:hypothetical protein